MTAAVAEKLRAAKALIERGWAQGEWHRAGRVCALSALHKARVPQEGDNALREVIGQRSIVEWNDTPERTQADVIAAFDRAISLAETSSG